MPMSGEASVPKPMNIPHQTVHDSPPGSVFTYGMIVLNHTGSVMNCRNIMAESLMRRPRGMEIF